MLPSQRAPWRWSGSGRGNDGNLRRASMPMAHGQSWGRFRLRSHTRAGDFRLVFRAPETSLTTGSSWDVLAGYRCGIRTSWAVRLLAVVQRQDHGPQCPLGSDSSPTTVNKGLVQL